MGTVTAPGTVACLRSADRCRPPRVFQVLEQALVTWRRKSCLQYIDLITHLPSLCYSFSQTLLSRPFPHLSSTYPPSPPTDSSPLSHLSLLTAAAPCSAAMEAGILLGTAVTLPIPTILRSNCPPIACPNYRCSIKVWTASLREEGVTNTCVTIAMVLNFFFIGNCNCPSLVSV